MEDAQNGMEDLKNGMKDRLPYFHTNYFMQQACQTQFGSGVGSRRSVLGWAGLVKECQLQIFSFVFQYHVLSFSLHL